MPRSRESLVGAHPLGSSGATGVVKPGGSTSGREGGSRVIRIGRIETGGVFEELLERLDWRELACGARLHFGVVERGEVADIEDAPRLDVNDRAPHSR